MFWRAKDPAKNWIISHMKRDLRIGVNDAENLWSRIQSWEGYSDSLTQAFCVYPADKSIPLLTYALMPYKPTGFLAVGRAPGKLALYYGRNGVTVLLHMVHSGPAPSFIRALHSLYYQAVVNEKIGEFYWMMLNGLMITKDLISGSEMQDALDVIEEAQPYWSTLTYSKEFAPKIDFLRTL